MRKGIPIGQMLRIPARQHQSLPYFYVTTPANRRLTKPIKHACLNGKKNNNQKNKLFLGHFELQ